MSITQIQSSTTSIERNNSSPPKVQGKQTAIGQKRVQQINSSEQAIDVIDNKRRSMILQILQTLIAPNEFRDPMGLSSEGIKQKRVGQVIDNFRQQGKTLIEPSHVPGHVKGVRPGTASYLCMNRGALLYQFVKPVCVDKSGNTVNGYIGTYFSLDAKTTPDNLGIHDQIIDPGTDQRIPRQQVCFLLNEPVTTVVRSIAKRIIDDFSIRGERHEAKGGAVQYFIGIHLDKTPVYLTIIIPPFLSNSDIDRITKIAIRNRVQIRQVTAEEFSELESASDQVTSSLSESTEVMGQSANIDDALLEALQLTKIGKYKHAIEVLKKTPQDDEKSKTIISLLLSCLYAVVEDEELRERSDNAYQHHRRGGNATTNTEICLSKWLISSRHTYDNFWAIHKLQASLPLIESGYKSRELPQPLLRLQILTLLELGKRFNRLYASSTPYMTTYQDTLDIAELAKNMTHAEEKALGFLKLAIEKCDQLKSPLYIQELIHLRNQYAHALYRLGNHQAALEQLMMIEEWLDVFVQDMRDTFSPAALDELELLQLSIKIRLFLILSKLKKEDFPDKYKGVAPQQRLQELAEQLRIFDHTQLMLMKEKLLALNDSDYHITNWLNHGVLSFAGTNFVGVIRDVVPIDWKTINAALEEQKSDAKSLEIPFLGLAAPCGMNDEQCKAFLNALSMNKSLQSLALRKFSVIIKEKDQNEKKVVVYSTVQRTFHLLEMLTAAQKRGMQLEHLSYDGCRFDLNDADKKDMVQACEFIEGNTSLKSFFPDLYDWTNDFLLERFVRAIKNHPNLEVLYAGIWEENPRAGEIMYNILKDREKPIRIVLHPNRLNPDENKKAIHNNEWLQRLNDVMEARFHN